jgi:hypothetical protein
MSLGCMPLSKENASVSQSDGRGVYVSRVEFVSAILRKFTIFALHTKVICILESSIQDTYTWQLGKDTKPVSQITWQVRSKIHYSPWDSIWDLYLQVLCTCGKIQD